MNVLYRQGTKGKLIIFNSHRYSIFVNTHKSFSTKNASSILLIPLVLLLLSCGSSSNTGSNVPADTTVLVAPAAYDTTLPKGRVKDSVVCSNNGTICYALYLPSYYTPSRPFPCVFFFDAHGRGTLPVKAYKAIAEQYGFVLAGCNASKNGIDWPSSEQIAKTMMNDTRFRINIDTHRIYT